MSAATATHVAGNIAVFAVTVLATARLNRLVVNDVITAPLRGGLHRRTGPIGRFLAAMTSCVWCTGMYTAAGVTAYTHWATGWSWTYLPLTALAVAWAAPTLAGWLED